MNNNFSENLKKIRKDNKLSQEQLAEEIGVSRQAISKWESAAAYPEMDKIILLCDKFNLNIDDLLHKNIKEIKSDEETKKNSNKYIDDFLNFITTTINMFSSMSFKSKIKCLFEQCVVVFILFLVFILIGAIGYNLISGILGLMPETIYYVIYSIIKLIYFVFSLTVSLVIVFHIFKSRYLEYYEKLTKTVINDTIIDENKSIEINSVQEEKKKHCENIDKKNRISFERNENKIIIRDPKHSEYKFINGLSKFIIGIIKIFSLLFLMILFVILIFTVFGFIVSFIVYKTGFFFIGSLILFLSSSLINVIGILILLNFVFNRKNDKKKIIWSTISSIILFGVGCGFVFIGTLNFEYIENDPKMLKTGYIEFDMNNDLFFESYAEIVYEEANIDNVKVEYTINKYCDIQYSDHDVSAIHIWGYCSNPIKLIKEVINNLSDKKIISINNRVVSIKIYTTSENIEKLKYNRELHYKESESRENLVNSYESTIN